MPSRRPGTLPQITNNKIADSALESAEFLTAAETAKAKEVTVSAVYKAIVQNRLPAQSVLGRIALRPQDVAAWTPASYVGRPVGVAMSEDAKARISAGQKRRWANRRAILRPRNRQ